MKKLTISIFLLISFFGNAKIIDFIFLENNIDTTSIQFIKTIKCIGKAQENIPSLFKAIKTEAQNLGANCFKLRHFSRDSSNIITLTLDTYFASDSILVINDDSHPRNTVFIFCNDKNSKESHTFNLNKEKKTIKSGTYYKYKLKEGEEVKINKGGIFGATVWIKWEQNRQARFLSITGFSVADPRQPGPYPTAGASISFTTGSMAYIDKNMGRLLVEVLKLNE